MKISSSTTICVLVAAAAAGYSNAFAPSAPSSFGGVISRRHVVEVSMSTMADAGVPPATSEASPTVADIEIPTNLPSEVGKDYVPLATMLATGELAEADQVIIINKATCLQIIFHNCEIIISPFPFFLSNFSRSIILVYTRRVDRNFWRESERKGFRVLHRREEHPCN